MSTRQPFDDASPTVAQPARAAGGVDVVVVGGCGHVGLPLGIALANTGLKVVAYDTDPDAVELVNGGVLPFSEEQGREQLARAIADQRFTATTKPDVVGDADTVIVVVGTPVDEHLNPEPLAVLRAVTELEHVSARPASCSSCAAPCTRV